MSGLLSNAVMAQEIVLPQWGMGMEEGTIVKWLRKGTRWRKVTPSAR